MRFDHWAKICIYGQEFQLAAMVYIAHQNDDHTLQKEKCGLWMGRLDGMNSFAQANYVKKTMALPRRH